MNKEKELLLKLLMEKYEGEDLDDCEESCSGCDYGSYGGATYKIVEPEPEVWEEIELGGPYKGGGIQGMIYAVRNATRNRCTRVRLSSHQNIEFSFKGGDPKLIAKALWMTKPAGIGLKGDLTVVIKDSSGHDKHINFNYEYA